MLAQLLLLARPTQLLPAQLTEPAWPYTHPPGQIIRKLLLPLSSLQHQAAGGAQCRVPRAPATAAPQSQPGPPCDSVDEPSSRHHQDAGAAGRFSCRQAGSGAVRQRRLAASRRAGAAGPGPPANWRPPTHPSQADAYTSHSCSTTGSMTKASVARVAMDAGVGGAKPPAAHGAPLGGRERPGHSEVQITQKQWSKRANVKDLQAQIRLAGGTCSHQEPSTFAFLDHCSLRPLHLAVAWPRPTPSGRPCGCG